MRHNGVATGILAQHAILEWIFQIEKRVFLHRFVTDKIGLSDQFQSEQILRISDDGIHDKLIARASHHTGSGSAEINPEDQWILRSILNTAAGLCCYFFIH